MPSYSMKMAGYKSYSDQFRQLTENILRECAIYKIYIPPNIINYYLPDRLRAFRIPTRNNPKRRFLFFSPLVSTRTHIDDYIDQVPISSSFDDVLQQISQEHNPMIRYNFVILDDYVVFIRMPRVPDELYRALCKHITISGRAKYARFSGEMWCNGHNHFMINNKSGTYQPPDSLLEPTVRIFKTLQPNAHFQGISFLISALPTLKLRH